LGTAPLQAQEVRDVAQQKIRYTFNLQDAEGVRAAMALYGTYDDTQIVSVMVSDLAAVKALVAAVTDAQVIGTEVTVVGTGAAAPGGFADSEVEMVGEFSFLNTAGRTWTDVIPSIKDASVVAGHINLSDTDIAALRTFLEESTGTFLQTDRNWLRTGVLRSAFLGDRKHHRGLKRASYEVPSA
jgi:hypothetical protein